MVQPGLENGSQKGGVPEWGEGWGRCFRPPAPPDTAEAHIEEPPAPEL